MIHSIDLNFQGIKKAIASYLIETKAGPILVETGPHSTYEHLKEGIKQTGYDISQIKHVFLSHIHLDHAGAAWALAESGAKIYVHPFGARNMEDPTRLMESATRIYGDKMDTLWGTMKKIPAELLYQVEDQEVFDLGDTTLKAWHTPGHAKHHIAWQINDIVFTGDVAGVKIGDGPVMPPCPPPDINIEDWKNSIQLLKKIQPAQLYLTHFNAISDIEGHLTALENILDDWAGWIKEKWEANESAEEVTPKFMEYTAQQLRSQGLSDQEIETYEAANPSWMSVAGLMRYWTKKSQAE